MSVNPVQQFCEINLIDIPGVTGCALDWHGRIVKSLEACPEDMFDLIRKIGTLLIGIVIYPVLGVIALVSMFFPSDASETTEKTESIHKKFAKEKCTVDNVTPEAPMPRFIPSKSTTTVAPGTTEITESICKKFAKEKCTAEINSWESFHSERIPSRMTFVVKVTQNNNPEVSIKTTKNIKNVAELQEAIKGVSDSFNFEIENCELPENVHIFAGAMSLMDDAKGDYNAQSTQTEFLHEPKGITGGPSSIRDFGPIAGEELMEFFPKFF